MVKPEKRPSVLMVGNFLSQSAGSRGVCEDLAEQLRARGWSVITTSNKKGRLVRLIDMLITAWVNRSKYVVAQVDVYSGHAFFWAEAVCSMLKVLNKQFVLTLHGGNLPEFARQHSVRARRLLSSAAFVTAPSDYLRTGLGSFRADIQYIPNGLEIERYSFHIRRRVEPKLVWLRAFHNIYNPVLAVEAVRQLAREFTGLELCMIGPDKGDGSLQATSTEAQRLGVDGRIIFPGKIPKADVPMWLNKGDIFINTTNVDNTPVSVIEAMACGLCVVSTNVGGIPYLLEDEIDALLVPPGKPEALASAIRRILTEPGLAERLSSNARKKVELFNWSEVLPKWDRILIEGHSLKRSD